MAAAGLATYAVLSTQPEGISITTEGSPVVGMDFRFILTVRMPGFTPQSPTFLSLDDVQTFEIVSGDRGDDPWGMANIWNVTGMDLSAGARFVLETTPVWAAEQRLFARLWGTSGNLSKARFVAPGVVDPSSVSTHAVRTVDVTTSWPLHVQATGQGNFAAGRELNLTMTVRGQIAGARSPTLLYLSFETRPIYYQVLSSTGGDNPWGLTNVWNLTAVDLSEGVAFRLTVTPVMSGSGIPFDLRVWSPRAGWPAVRFTNESMLQNPYSVFLWASVTVSFAIA